jgi:hypothetical protein
MQKEFTRHLKELEEYIGRPEFAEELERARKGYFEQIGYPREGEPFFEMRLMSFVEWFAFDRKLDSLHLTPISLFIKEKAQAFSERDREILAGFEKSIHSLFRVEKRKGAQAKLRDQFHGRRYKRVEGLAPSLDRGDLAEARIVPLGACFHLTEAYCYHPAEAQRFIIHELKRARKNEDDLEGLLRQFMAMSTKWERYPRMRLSEIYKW